MQTTEKIQGIIERITFHSEETGFFVIRIKAKGHRELVTVVGNAITLNTGEYIAASGTWINNKSYGLQFKATEVKLAPPTSIEGLEKYLGSGLIRGIGPHTAKQLVKAFGDQVFTVLDTKPKQLKKLSRIGNKRLKTIMTSWQDQKIIREIMVFLQSHGVGTARAVRIYKSYGDTAIDKVRENPYRLAKDIYGIGFKTADTLAQQLGIAKDSMLRAVAGITFALQEFSNAGHCAAHYEDLIKKCEELLEIPQGIIVKAIDKEVAAQHLIVNEIAEKKAIYLAALFQIEKNIANHLDRLKNGTPSWGSIDSAKAIIWVQHQTGIMLSPSQQTAVKQALNNKLMIITGGPGVGKTTIVNSILKIIRAKGVQIALCAPTGRAAKRLSESTGIQAKTIHRLLKYNPKQHEFMHGPHNPLPADLVVIDEASMIDIILMNSLLKAIPNHAALLIIGDVDQLPSVGPGLLLYDLINSKAVPTITLTEIFRQAATSKIIVNAHRINQGQIPYYGKNAKQLEDFYVIPATTPEEIHDKLLQVITQRIPKVFGFDPLHDIQVLTPMNRSALGANSLNLELQKHINPTPLVKIDKFGITYAVGDKVIQNINNYDKEVFNGDIGYISAINLEESTMHINFDGQSAVYNFNELDEISLAYAITIHKSQGSEYPVVVIPLAMQHYMMLAKNLLYTGVTRGKNLVIIIGEPKAVAMAVRNSKTQQRLTNLQTRLQIMESDTNPSI